MGQCLADSAMSSAIDASVEAQARQRVGRVLCGRYRLVRLIGVGGMGAVYSAVHHRNGHRFAVKVLHPTLSLDRECRRRFRREALVANQIGHPGALEVLDDDVADDGSAFLVLPLLTGETLRARWERSGRKLPFAEVVAVTHAVLDVLAAAHAANVVHRDIKPENVFVTRSGEIRVLDFGIARLMVAGDSPFANGSGATASTALLGTPAFMAPEQALGRSRDIDARTDLWAVGAMMFTLFSGRFVHEGETSVELLVKAATRPVTSVEEACPDLPAPVRAVVERALAFDKEARWPDAASMNAALAAAFREVSGADPSTIPPLTAPEPGATDSGLDVADRPSVEDAGATGSRSEGSAAHAHESGSLGARLSPMALSRTTRPATDVVGSRGPRRFRRAGAAIGLALLVGAGALAVGPVRSALRPRATATRAPQADAELLSRCASGARPALAAGLQLWRDASESEAAERFDEASKADPLCAVASVYYVLSQYDPYPRRREEFQMAREHRALLTPRELDLLDALEPSVEVPPRLDQVVARTAALLAKWPGDPDIEALRLRTLLLVERVMDRPRSDDDEVVAAGNAAAARGTISVPQLEAFRAVVEGQRGHLDRALEHLRRCLEAAPDSGDCMYFQGVLQGALGQCSAAEGTFRHFAAVAPDNHGAYWLLGQAMLPSNVPAARVAFEQGWSRLSPNAITQEPFVAAQVADEFRMALAVGDLEKALDLARSWNAKVASSIAGRFRLDPLVYRIEILRELGRMEEARALAQDGLMEQRAWTPETSARVDAFIWFARLAYLTGAIAPAQFRQYRQEWISRRRRREIDVWLQGYAGLPEVGSDMAIPVNEGAYVEDWF
jgi:serine/threonine-protein kinase